MRLPLTRKTYIFRKAYVFRKAYTFRKAILWVLAVSVILSGVHLELSLGAAFSQCQNRAPLSAENYHTAANKLYHDISTGEITGAKNANTILYGSIRGRGQVLYRNTVILDFMEKHTACSLLLKSVAQHSRSIGIHSICTIIRYIHNQDGEKGSPNLYNLQR